MNPNLLIFLKRSAFLVAIAALMTLLFYLIDQFTSVDLQQIGEYAMYAFFAVVMGFMMVLMIGITFKSVLTGIMRRSDNIFLCCPDKKHRGIHIIGKHFFSGGETSDGYDAFHHYYINIDDGKMFLSKKIKGEKN